MKKVLLLAAIAVFLVACAQEPYTINGEITGKNEGKIIYLSSGITSKHIDSTTIKDSKFTFKGVLDRPDIGSLKVKDVPRSVSIVLEPGEINVKISGYTSIGALSGTPLNDAKFKCYRSGSAIWNKYNKIFDSLKIVYKDDTERYEEEVDKLSEEYAWPEVDAHYKTEFEKNRNNILGVEIYTSNIARDESLEDILAFMEQNPYASDYRRLTRIVENIKTKENTEEGKMFVDFAGRNIEDTEDVKLSDYVGKGKYVLIDFWTVLFSTCEDSLSGLTELHKKYASKGLVAVGVSIFGKHDEVLKITDDLDKSLKHIYVPLDADEANVMTLYGSAQFPTLILFAPDGTIEKRSHKIEEMVEYIDNLYKSN